MTDVIYNYPKSSCACWKCDQDKYPKPTGHPTNMSVRGCIFSEYYDCNQQRIFKSHQEPSKQSGRVLLNQSVISSDKFDPTFKAINVKDCPNSSCMGTTYLNSDPRLYNAAAATWLQLDRPPTNSTPKLNTLNSNKSLDNYGQCYKSYADVNAGQILYYIDKDRQDAFYEPLFSKQATSVGTLYKDPMGAMKPQYDRIPNKKYNPILGDQCDVAGEFCLSYMKDTQFHREDLLALEMRKINQERYAPRWTNLNE